MTGQGWGKGHSKYTVHARQQTEGKNQATQTRVKRGRVLARGIRQGGYGRGEVLSENLRSIPKACAAGQQFRVPDGSVKKRSQNPRSKQSADLVEHNVKKRVVTTQNALDVTAGVHFEREGLFHIGSELRTTFAHLELLSTGLCHELERTAI